MATAAVALSVAAASAYAQHEIAAKQAERVEEQQEKMQKLQGAIQNEEATRSRRQSIQKALIAQAQIENQAAAAGTTGSSADIAGAQNVSAQTGANIRSVNESVDRNRIFADQQQEILKAQQPTLFESVASGVAGGVGQAAAGAAGQSLFS